MANNCKIELNGVLGHNAKVVEKDGKTFVVLRIATTDNYPVEENGKTIWKNKESLWHDVLVFRPYSVTVAKSLKRGDFAEISGSLSYRPFKDENGYTKYEACIIARYVKKIEVGKEEDPTRDEISEVVEVARS